MKEAVLVDIKIIFLLGFILHNLEEAIRLPQWSKYARKFHPPVQPNQFIFGVIIMTIAGYLLTVLDLLGPGTDSFAAYLYLAFVGILGLNAIIPHLLATIVLKRYAPGLTAGMLLNLPVSIIILWQEIENGVNILLLILAITLLGGLMLWSLKPLFRAGHILINFSNKTVSSTK